MTDVSLPTDHELRAAIEANAADLARADEHGTPGTTRISLLVEKRDGDVTARVRADTDNATPLPALDENEVYLYRLAPARDWDEDSHREWWLSGDGVREAGLDYFEHRRDGPVPTR